MNRAEWLQETRKMGFEEAYGGWQGGPLPQEEAARLASQPLLFWLLFACALLIYVLFVSHRGFYESTRTM